jgi:trehalose-phosphatase
MIIPLLKERVFSATHVFLLLDYDGTLEKIHYKRSQKGLNKKTRRILDLLSKSPTHTVGIISGRQRQKLIKAVGLKRLIYSGNHGLEMSGQNFNFVHRKAETSLPFIQSLKKKIGRELKRENQSCWIEDKKYSFAIHYKEHDEKISTFIKKHLFIHLTNKKLSLIKSKDAYEFRPYIKWDKSNAVRMIQKKQPQGSLTIYIGDDQSDECVFKYMGNQDISIKVGRAQKTAARYSIDFKNVTKLLHQLLKLQQTKTLPEL